MALVVRSYGVAAGHAPRRVDLRRCHVVGAPEPRDRGLSLAITQAHPHAAETATGLVQGRAMRQGVAGGIGTATPGVSGATVEVGRRVPSDRQAGAGVGRLPGQRDAETGISTRVAPGRPDVQATPWWPRSVPVAPLARPAPAPAYDPGPAEGQVYDRVAGYVPPYAVTPLAIRTTYIEGVPAPRPYPVDSASAVVWRSAVRSGLARDRRFVCAWGRTGPGGYVGRRGTGGVGIDIEIPRWIIPIRRFYLMLHDVELVRVSDGVPIPCSALAVRADADAWADTLTATCHGPDAFDLLAASEAVEVEARVDGATWRMVVERPQESLRLGSRAIALTGHSLSALLHSPHQKPADYAEAQARTAAQLAEQVLPIGGGWTVVWDVPDWLVPADAWAYVGQTPVQALVEIAAAVGAVIRPSRTLRTLTVQPRYRTLPWAYGSVAEDLIVPDGLWLSAARRSGRPQQANAVDVQGGQVGGVQGRVYVTGSAGDRLAPSVQHALVTHADAARERGAQVLAAAAETSGLGTLVLPFDGGQAWPLAEVGWVVRVDRWGTVYDTVMGVDLAVSLSDRDIKIHQTLALGDDSGNAYTRLRRALGFDAPVLVAQITINHGDGTVTVTYPGGGVQRVRGDGLVGSRVWVREGRVEGLAPAMTAYELPV